jgi:hypothetical protein
MRRSARRGTKIPRVGVNAFVSQSEADSIPAKILKQIMAEIDDAN